MVGKWYWFAYSILEMLRFCSFRFSCFRSSWCPSHRCYCQANSWYGASEKCPSCSKGSIFSACCCQCWYDSSCNPYKGYIYLVLDIHTLFYWCSYFLWIFNFFFCLVLISISLVIVFSDGLSPGDTSRSYPLQFGTISPGFVNGMQVY